MSRRGVLGPGTTLSPTLQPLHLSSSHPYKPNTSITLPHIPHFDDDALVRGGLGCRRAAGGGPECTTYAKVARMWVWCWDVGHKAAQM